MEDFDKEIYGRVPAVTPKVSWEITSTVDTTIGSVAVKIKNLLGHIDNSDCPKIKADIQLTVTMPAHVMKPVPMIMEFGFVFPAGFRFPAPPPRVHRCKKAGRSRCWRKAGPVLL